MSLWSRALDLAGRTMKLGGRRRNAIRVLAVFLLANLALAILNHPWSILTRTTWPCGYEAGRIARNLCLGLGYGSPFVLFPGDAPPGVPITLAEKEERDGSRTSWAFKDFQRWLAKVEQGLSADGSPTVSRTWELPPGFSVPPTAWTPPPIVYLWAGLFAVFGIYSVASWVAFVVLQLGLLTLAIYLLWRTLTIAAGNGAATLGLLFLVTYPPVWNIGQKDVHVAALYVFLLSLSLYAVARYFRGDGWRWAWGYALAGALAVLAKPVGLFFFGLATLLVLHWLWRRRPVTATGAVTVTGGFRRSRFAGPGATRRFVLVLILSMGALWSPWIVRNALVFHSFIPFGTNLPMELWFGNNEGSPADPFAAHMERFPAFNAAQREQLLEMGEVAYGNLCWHRFRGFVTRHPGTYLRLCLDRVVYFWTLHPYKTNPWRPYLTIVFLGYLLLWLGAHVLAGRTGRSRAGWLEGLGALYLLVFPLTYYFTHFSEYRYRFPLEIVVMVMAAAATARWLEVRTPESAPPDPAEPGRETK